MGIQNIVFNGTNLSKSEFSRRTGISYSSLRDQLSRDESELSSTASAWWSAALYAQMYSPSLFQEAFLGIYVDHETDEGRLRLAESLERDVRTIHSRVVGDFARRPLDTPESCKESSDLLDHLTCAARLLRLRQVSIRAEMERKELANG